MNAMNATATSPLHRNFYGELVIVPPRPVSRGDFEDNLLALTSDLRRPTSLYVSSFQSIPDRRDVAEQVLAAEPELRALGVVELHLFGSIARGDAGWNSDVDVAVRLADDSYLTFGPFDAASLLERRLRRHVDLVLLPLNECLARYAEEDLVRVF